MASAREPTLTLTARIPLLVACDWNGTIADDVDHAVRATSATLVSFGLQPITLAAFRERFCLPLAAFFCALGVGPDGCETAEHRWNEEMLSLGPSRLSAGVQELLQAADELAVPVGVISAASRAVLMRDIDHAGLSGRFSFVVGGVVSKRDALAVLAEAAETVVYVGDTEFDLQQASAAGALTIGFGGGYRPADALAEAGADWQIGEILDVLPILRSLAD
jgi:phosphoglycolate phosphatase-like HAD superfamily hydrolase